ncbi:MAG: FixH family protein [Gammaproteobacteria bacterium]|nr:FixH family protein [Gammaproteobacteria bacterium]
MSEPRLKSQQLPREPSTTRTWSKPVYIQHWYKSPLLLGWLFLVFMAMTGTIYMVIQANSGFPGLVVDDFYERGQDYEKNIKIKLDNNSKWLPHFQMSQAYQNKTIVIKFVITNKTGQFVPVESMTLYAYRPSDSKQDFSRKMILTPEKKGYQARMRFESKGKWDLLASAVIDGIEVNYAKSIFVKD